MLGTGLVKVEPLGPENSEDRRFTEKLIAEIESSFDITIKEHVNNEGCFLFTAKAKGKDEIDEEELLH